VFEEHDTLSTVRGDSRRILVEHSDIPKRRTRKHLDFPPPKLRTRRPGVRISPGAPPLQICFTFIFSRAR
jgi:hypothetical protein